MAFEELVDVDQHIRLVREWRACDRRETGVGSNETGKRVGTACDRYVYEGFFVRVVFEDFQNLQGLFVAEAACCSHGIDMESKLSVIFFAWGSSASSP